MNDKTVAASNTPPVATEPLKAPYKQPELVAFGSVSDLTLTGFGTGADGGAVTMQMVSDQRAKEHIVLIGQHPLCIGIYAYHYKAEYRDRWGHGVQIGVLAQEVEMVLPEAVQTDDNGLKSVDYGRLQAASVCH